MKTFFGGNFIENRLLKEAGINYPIKLEYFKNINEGSTLKENKAKYGVSITKTEYKKEGTKIENNEIKYLTNDENRVEQVLNMLKVNLVTPMGLNEIIWDYAKQIL